MSPSADSRILVSWLGPEFSPHPALSRREREFFLLTRGRSLREVTERSDIGVEKPISASPFISSHREESPEVDRGRSLAMRERERGEGSGRRSRPFGRAADRSRSEILSKQERRDKFPPAFVTFTPP